MDFDLRARTILLTVAGSRAYGLHTAASDVDVKGVAIPPSRYFHGFLHRFDQADRAEQVACFAGDLTGEERGVVAGAKLEGSVYNLVKFAALAADCNPNMLDALFCRDAEVRLATPIGERLRENAKIFLSAKARHTFAGYAASQLKRIRGHRRWLLEPPKREPLREDFDLPQRTLIPADQLAAAEAAIQKKLDEWEIDFGRLDSSEVIHIQTQIVSFLAEIMETSDARWRNAARAIGYDENFMALLDRERRYKSARKEWEQYQEWKRSRNAARAELESKHSYDSKHASHLVRLLKMCGEILEKGEVNVWRGGIDADELRGVREGAWTYDQLIEWVEAEEKRIEELWRSGKMAVPRLPDRDAIDALVVELVEAGLAGG